MVDVGYGEASTSADRRMTFATARVVHMLARCFRVNGGKAALLPALQVPGDAQDASAGL